MPTAATRPWRRTVADVRPILGDLAEALREVLRDDLVGIYLRGSYALGDADADSDVDVIVGVREPLTHRPRRTACSRCMRAVHDLARPLGALLEGSYFPLAMLRGCDRRDEPLWYLGNGARERSGRRTATRRSCVGRCGSTASRSQAPSRRRSSTR